MTKNVNRWAFLIAACARGFEIQQLAFGAKDKAERHRACSRPSRASEKERDRMIWVLGATLIIPVSLNFKSKSFRPSATGSYLIQRSTFFKSSAAFVNTIQSHIIRPGPVKAGSVRLRIFAAPVQLGSVPICVACVQIGTAIGLGFACSRISVGETCL